MSFGSDSLNWSVDPSVSRGDDINWGPLGYVTGGIVGSGSIDGVNGGAIKVILELEDSGSSTKVEIIGECMVPISDVIVDEDYEGIDPEGEDYNLEEDPNQALVKEVDGGVVEEVVDFDDVGIVISISTERGTCEPSCSYRT